MQGLITKAQSGFFWVRTEAGQVVVCHLRGRLKQHRQASDLAAVGDQVEISLQPDGKGMIETVAPRTRVLSRRAPGNFGVRFGAWRQSGTSSAEADRS